MLNPLRHLPAVEAKAAVVSVTVGVCLVAVKFGAYFLTGSTTVFADALEGIVNVTASSFALYALVLAHRPADPEHPYGHGKIEFFSAGLEGGMILLAGGVAIVRALDALIVHQHLTTSGLGVGVTLMAAAVAANTIAGGYLIRVGQARASITLEADGWHLLTDAVTSFGAVLALLVVRTTGWAWVDPVVAIFVSIYIAITGLKLIRRSAAGLMDEQDEADNLVIRKILDAHTGTTGRDPQICSYHKLRHRHSGRFHWVDFHIMVPGTWHIEAGHRVASAIEYEIEQALGEGNATAHVEPCDDDTDHPCANPPVVGPPPAHKISFPELQLD